MTDELDPTEQNEEVARTGEGDARETANDDVEEFEEVEEEKSDIDE